MLLTDVTVEFWWWQAWDAKFYIAEKPEISNSYLLLRKILNKIYLFGKAYRRNGSKLRYFLRTDELFSSKVSISAIHRPKTGHSVESEHVTPGRCDDHTVNTDLTLVFQLARDYSIFLSCQYLSCSANDLSSSESNSLIFHFEKWTKNQLLN